MNIRKLFAYSLAFITVATAAHAQPRLFDDIAIQKTLTLTGDISPSQITSDQNNYAPTNFSSSSILRLSTDESRTITGLTAGTDGRYIVITNVGSNPLVLAAESSSSTAANRFALGATLTLAANGGTVALIYDSTSSRWRPLVAKGGTSENPLTFNSPLSRSTDTISIANAAADGSTKGAASFTANDFDASSGNISIDYTNGQAASGSTKGFLTSGDWTTFNGKVSTGAITGSGLTMATSRILGRTTASTGAIEELTASGVLDIIGSTRGSVLYRGASGWDALTPGTSGYVLTSNGTGADPTYQVIPAGFSNPMTTAGDIIIGGSSGTATRLAATTNGYVLTLSGGSPVWAAATGGFTNPMTTAGDIIIGGSSGTATRLAGGTDGYVLKMVSGAPAWASGSGSGDVVGPASAVDSRIAAFDTTTGKLIKDGGKTIAEINPIGSQTIYIPAAALTPSYTAGCTTLKLTAGASGQPDLQYVEFDPSTEQYAQFNVAMPKSWNNSTVTLQFVWSHPSTTTNFGTVWGAQAVAVSDGDALAASYGTAQTVTDTGGTTDTLYITSATSAITVAGTPATGDTIFFRVYRKAADASDTMTVVARLFGVKVIYTTNAPNDT